MVSVKSNRWNFWFGIRSHISQGKWIPAHSYLSRDPESSQDIYSLSWHGYMQIPQRPSLQPPTVNSILKCCVLLFARTDPQFILLYLCKCWKPSLLSLPHLLDDGTAIWFGHLATWSKVLEFSWALKLPWLFKFGNKFIKEWACLPHLSNGSPVEYNRQVCCITNNHWKTQCSQQKVFFSLRHLRVGRDLATKGLGLGLLHTSLIFPGPALTWSSFFPWQKRKHKRESPVLQVCSKPILTLHPQPPTGQPSSQVVSTCKPTEGPWQRCAGRTLLQGVTNWPIFVLPCKTKAQFFRLPKMATLPAAQFYL